MYKFIIKGIDGSIKHTSINTYTTISDAQKDGRNYKKHFVMVDNSTILLSDSVDVIPVCNANELIVQQY